MGLPGPHTSTYLVVPRGGEEGGPLGGLKGAGGGAVVTGGRIRWPPVVVDEAQGRAFPVGLLSGDVAVWWCGGGGGRGGYSCKYLAST